MIKSSLIKTGIITVLAMLILCGCGGRTGKEPDAAEPQYPERQTNLLHLWKQTGMPFKVLTLFTPSRRKMLMDRGSK